VLDAIRGEHIMSASTAGQILARLGMVERRRSRHRSPGPPERMPYTIGGAGDAMTTDFKGQFRTRDGRLCYPLTIADPFSRYVLAITALPSTHGSLARRVFERVFREYGIPRLIISDNGSPFASAASLGGLTQLSRWWIELGSTPMRIEPGRPQQNGIHERMHRTFKKSLQRQPPATFGQQQRRFDLFRTEFNEVRPHQSLGQKPPATVFRPYRPFERPKPFDHDRNMEVRRVNEHGAIKWNGREVFISEVMIGALIALLPVGETLYAIYFRHVRIGWLDTLEWRAISRRPQPRPTSR
jgi:transposase InsO family protein